MNKPEYKHSSTFPLMSEFVSLTGTAKLLREKERKCKTSNSASARIENILMFIPTVYSTRMQ